MFFQKFEALNKKLNIKKNDVVFFHINLSSFRVFCNEIKPNEIYYFAFFLLRSYFYGKGTFLIPSFSYSFCKTQKFDTNKTKSEVGMLANFLISHYPQNRSSNPIFSVLSFGSKFKRFKNSSNLTCFGNNSCFERLIKNNGKICFLGASFDRITFIHYLEEKYQVNYRFNKIFNGIVDDEKVKIDYFVRDLYSKKKFNFNKLKSDLIKKKKLKKVSIGKFNFFSIKCKDLDNEFKKNYRINNNYYLKK